MGDLPILLLGLALDGFACWLWTTARRAPR
jgi:hypothetical protein